jgi:hypothetical protein
MVVDNKLIPIKSYVKSKYTDRYTNPSLLGEVNAKIEKETNELRESSSLYNTMKMVNNELVIPGFDMNHEEIIKFSIASKTIYRKLTGAASETSINSIKLSILGNSMMVFKNWIPNLWYTRFAGLEKNNDPFDRDSYDVGRIKLLMNVFTSSIADKTGGILDVLKVNDKGVLALDNLYKKYSEEYLRNTGREFTMDRAAFNDMIIQNLSNQMRELGILLGLMSAMFALGFVAPQPGDRRGKSALLLTERILGQFAQEISFYYNPSDWEQMLSKGMFPAMGIVQDAQKFTYSLFKETTGFDWTDPTKTKEEVRKGTYPIKMGLKLVPGAASWLKFTSLFSPELAKEMGIGLPENQNR